MRGGEVRAYERRGRDGHKQHARTLTQTKAHNPRPPRPHQHPHLTPPPARPHTGSHILSQRWQAKQFGEPLRQACAHGKIEMVRMLLDAKAPPDGGGPGAPGGSSPLLAALTQSLRNPNPDAGECARLLMSAGAELPAPEKAEASEALCRRLLLASSEAGCEASAVRTFVRAGVELNAPVTIGVGGFSKPTTPLLLATANKHHTFVRRPPGPSSTPPHPFPATASPRLAAPPTHSLNPRRRDPLTPRPPRLRRCGSSWRRGPTPARRQGWRTSVASGLRCSSRPVGTTPC